MKIPGAPGHLDDTGVRFWNHACHIVVERHDFIEFDLMFLDVMCMTYSEIAGCISDMIIGGLAVRQALSEHLNDLRESFFEYCAELFPDGPQPERLMLMVMEG